MKLLKILIALLVLPTLALAHGPSRQKVVIKQEINAPAAEVWAVIGDFYDMSWHPAVHATTGDGSLEPDKSQRVLVLGEEGGPEVLETLYKWRPEKMSYSYFITEVDVEVIPVTNYSAHLTVKAVDDNTSTVEWKGGFYRGFPNNEPPEHLNDEAAVAAVTGIYTQGLEALAARFAD